MEALEDSAVLSVSHYIPKKINKRKLRALFAFVAGFIRVCLLMRPALFPLDKF